VAAAQPPSPFTWDVVQLGTVYGKAYDSKQVYEAFSAKTRPNATAADCQQACAADGACTSYDWATGAAAAGGTCKYLGQCWLRADGEWQPKQQAACDKQSGRKVGPTPPPTPAPTAPAGARNVLFVIFDDLRLIHGTWDMGPQPHTPHTDALGARALAFDRAYCNQAVCGPSRASLLSGRRPDTTQMWNFVGGFRQTPGAGAWNTWPEYFKNRGYYTYGVGKLFVSAAHQSVHRFCARACAHPPPPAAAPCAPCAPLAPLVPLPLPQHPGDPKDFDPQSWSSGEYGGYFGQDSCPIKKNKSHGCAVNTTLYPDHVFPDLEALAGAKSALANATAPRADGAAPPPFWIGVGFVKPHMPHVFPAEFYEDVPALADIDLVANGYEPNGTARLEWESGAEGPAQGRFGNGTDPATARDWRRGYYAAAAFSDHLLGELLAALNATGAAADTVVVMTSDHGWGLGEHNHWVKYASPLARDLRVCFLVLLLNLLAHSPPPYLLVCKSGTRTGRRTPACRCSSPTPPLRRRTGGTRGASWSTWTSTPRWRRWRGWGPLT
jgi:arylsulfatase A-like enzyme